MGNIRNLCHDISLRVIIAIIDIITISVRSKVTVLQASKFTKSLLKLQNKVSRVVAKPYNNHDIDNNIILLMLQC